MGQAHVSRQRPELDTGATDLRMPESENATQPHRSSLPESLSAKFKGIFCKDPVPELGLGFRLPGARERAFLWIANDGAPVTGLVEEFNLS